MKADVTASTSIGGWTCYSCKTWVPNGSWHNCPYTYQGTSAAPATQADHGFRYAAALERIAAALEVIAGRLARDDEAKP
jgi:hypothetical protein